MTKNIKLPWPVFILLIISAFLAGSIRKKVNLETQCPPETKNSRAKNILFQPSQTNTPNIVMFQESFGNKDKLLRTNLQKAVQFFNQKVNWQPHYYFYTTKNGPKTENQCIAAKNNKYYCSPKGKRQLNQNIREICAWRLTNNPLDWWEFVNNVEENCSLENVDHCWQEQAKKVNLPTNQIQDCFSTQSIEILENEIKFLENKNIRQTPQIFINDSQLPINSQQGGSKIIVKINNSYFQNNQIASSEYLITALCSAFNNPPKICD